MTVIENILSNISLGNIVSLIIIAIAVVSSIVIFHNYKLDRNSRFWLAMGVALSSLCGVMALICNTLWIKYVLIAVGLILLGVVIIVNGYYDYIGNQYTVFVYAILLIELHKLGKITVNLQTVVYLKHALNALPLSFKTDMSSIAKDVAIKCHKDSLYRRAVYQIINEFDLKKFKQVYNKFVN